MPEVKIYREEDLVGLEETTYSELQGDIKRLTEEVEYYMDKCATLERLVQNQYESVKTMHKIFMLQEAELQKLRGETE